MRQLGKTPRIKPATRALTLQQIDPFESAPAKRALQRLRELCRRLPETSEGRQFGHPVWLAGKKTFLMARYESAALKLYFWVGIELQNLLTADPRFSIPPYFGHNGWIALNAARQCDWQEIAQLAERSYRHFALKRMLASMANSTAPSTPD